MYITKDKSPVLKNLKTPPIPILEKSIFHSYKKPPLSILITTIKY